MARSTSQLGKARSPKNQNRPIMIDIRHQDAFEFLTELEPESIDLIVSSPPYCMGKEYEKSFHVSDFIEAHERLAPLLSRVLRKGGSLCWQVGHHVSSGVVVPLDALAYSIFNKEPNLSLRNRIVWTFGHGVHATRRFSGRHETILWFTKGNEFFFDLDAVRVPQRYPGKRHYKGPNKGELSGNPKGKNPSDVWDIPNVKANHIEKTSHPCQFPVALVQRLIRALAKPEAVVADPFCGSGTTAVASLLESRSFIGCDNKKRYVAIARNRVNQTKEGGGTYRPIERPIFQPKGTESVARRPGHFRATPYD